ncbi:MAG: adenylate/guanylate cyclase domain-containing protein, partial [Thermoleophilia bacterium]
MIACPACGRESPEDYRFCPQCSGPLSGPPSASEERKVVTSLFCDLVGFTALSEQADPEDVDALLRRYYDAVRPIIETHGGTVEKFIGDAVVGVFGVPVVHEDDPERAVRAGLRIVQELDGMTRPDGSPLEARVGINTGEALVRLDVTPGSGEGFLTGDAVNTAARLEAAAPPMGVVVGAITHDLTTPAIVYEKLPPVAAKGKSEPVQAWLAKTPISRPGSDAFDRSLTPLVDREMELAYLKALFDKAVSATPQFALIVGEPGIGKSRLVRELFACVDSRSEMTTWRLGRCLPYGERVSFWALSEIVKAHAGILETDDAPTVSAKLDVIVPDGADRAWMADRLRALLGLEAPQAEREENFAAWLRLVEQLALEEPLVVVLEDLHWADDGLLAFIEHLATHVDAVPLLVVGTARPELFEQHPTFASGSAQVNRISLDRLTPQDTRRLVAGLVGDSDTLSQKIADVVERSAGNPFFAEESARLLTDQVRGASVPVSVQAVVAARLDGLPAEEKGILGDAAVVGEVFWDGAVAEVGHRERDAVDAMLRKLVGKRLVRRVRETSMAGESEFAFAHALARDVAYGQLPRAVKARKHAAVVTWIENAASARLDDLADVIAHHCATGLELARASGQEELADSLVEPAARYLTLAGDRAMQLDVPSAERLYARAIDVLPPGHPSRAAILVKWTDALQPLGDYRRAADGLTEAVAALTAAGDTRAAAVAMMKRASCLVSLGDPSAPTLGNEALALLEAEGPSPELVFALEGMASYHTVIDDSEAGLALAERAVAMAAQLGEPEPIQALHFRGVARCDCGDASGLDDLHRALAAAQERGTAREVAFMQFNLGSELWLFEGVAAVLEVRRNGQEIAEQRGLRALALFYSMGRAADLTWAGDWDGALSLSLSTDPEIEAIGDAQGLLWLRTERSMLLALRGEAASAVDLALWVTSKAHACEDALALLYAAFARAIAAHAVLDTATAHAALTEYERLVEHRVEADFALRLPLAVRLALETGDATLAERLAAHLELSLPLYRHSLASAGAAMAEARGEAAEAAAAFAAA